MNEPLNERWLQTMASAPQPKLSADFDRRLKQRIYNRRLNTRDCWLIGIYSAASIVVSIVSMRYESIPWLLIIVSVLLPLLLVGIVLGDIRQARRALLRRIRALTGFKSGRTMA